MSFKVRNGRVVEGDDPILSYLEMVDADGEIVYDLLLTEQMPDGEFALFTDGVTRAVAARIKPLL